MTRASLTALVAAAVTLGITAPPADAQAAAGQAPAARPKFVKPIRGAADIGYLAPTVKVDGTEVVTTMKIKNLSNGAIAGLRVSEYWYDKTGNMMPGASQLVKQPVLPGEVITVTLRTPRNAKMDRNTYQFSHANGTCKPKILKKLD